MEVQVLTWSQLNSLNSCGADTNRGLEEVRERSRGGEEMMEKEGRRMRKRQEKRTKREEVC